MAIVTAVTGCFVVWRRMSYFGDSLAHSSLLGIALGMVYGFELSIGVIISCSVFAVILVYLQQQKLLANDTLLGILAHSSLAIGMVAISLQGITDFDMHDYLFGDILTISKNDIYFIYAGGAAVLVALIHNWSDLVLMTIDEELAKAEGVAIMRNHIMIVMIMTLIVAISINIVGVLLITSMLIIPVATARSFAKSPESMAVIAVIFAVIGMAIGILCSAEIGTPSGPTIVTTATALFVVVLVVRLFRRV